MAANSKKRAKGWEWKNGKNLLIVLRKRNFEPF